jgi:hypothetical protein
VWTTQRIWWEASIKKNIPFRSQDQFEDKLPSFDKFNSGPASTLTIKQCGLRDYGFINKMLEILTGKPSQY